MRSQRPDKLERTVQPASRDEEDRFVVNPANWTVTTIEPAAGTEVDAGDTVVVTMTRK